MSLNLASCLSDSAEKYADQLAIICEDQYITYAELERWSAKIAEVFLEKGMKKGDHVLLLAPNVPEFTAVYFAILRLGAVVVPLNTLFLVNEISDLLEHSDAKFMVVWHALAEKGAAAFTHVETCKTLFIMGTDRQNLSPDVFADDSDRFLLDELVQEISDESILDTGNYCGTTSEDTAVILYTSGTTGKSKGVELSHFNLYSNASYTRRISALDIQPESVTLAVLPLFHTFGQTAVQNASIVSGATIVMNTRFEARRTLAEIEKHKVTHIAAVPTMYNLMVQTQKRHNFNVSALQVAVSGGASMPVAIYEEFEKVFNIKICEGYGLSETSPITCITPVRGSLNKPGSIGPAIYGTQVRIARSDGSFAEVGEVGELVIRGHNVMKGYYNDSAATEVAFFEGGWFRSGDVAKMDEDRFFYIVDRAKDVIIRAGMNIFPREIEEILHHHPAVLEAAVVGIPDETLSENVVAFVALAPNAEVTAQELQKYCRERLAIYKCPKFVRFVEQLPRNSTGKILKRALKEQKN